MKNKIISVMIGMAFVVSLAGCSQSNAGNSSAIEAAARDTAVVDVPAGRTAQAGNAVVQTAAAVGTAAITEDEAKKAALSHAGFAESDVAFIKSKIDRENGRQVYEVEFYSGNTEYDYDIDAVTGDIVSYDYDAENDTISSGAVSAQPNSEYIGEDKAKSIALAKVPGAMESNVRLYLDYDDGSAVYEGSVIYNELEYDFEISAMDGKIIEWDVESVYDG